VLVAAAAELNLDLVRREEARQVINARRIGHRRAGAACRGVRGGNRRPREDRPLAILDLCGQAGGPSLRRGQAGNRQKGARAPPLPWCLIVEDRLARSTSSWRRPLRSDSHGDERPENEQPQPTGKQGRIVGRAVRRSIYDKCALTNAFMSRRRRRWRVDAREDGPIVFSRTSSRSCPSSQPSCVRWYSSS
jgi:hypothetical protein